MKKLLHFVRVTFLWILLLPVGFEFLGLASNQAVLIANGDKFPVLVNNTKGFPRMGPDGMFDDVHCVMSSNTHLNALADIIDKGREGTESIGDVSIDFSEWLWSFCPWVWGVVLTKRVYELRDK